MFKRAFSVFSRQSATNTVKAAKVTKASKVTKITKSTKTLKVGKDGENKLNASEILKLAQDKVKDAKHDADMPIVWIDCEMTGLDHKNDSIIEICCLITDKELKLIEEKGYESVIHQPKETMDNMNEWCILHHGQSGLTDKVIKSKKSKEVVEQELLEYLQKYMNKGVGILAGNSVHMDRLFMLKDMPKVVEYLTYRIIDVSSVYEISRRVNPLVASSRPKKKGAHTAREDILESIKDLVYYRGVLLRKESETKTETIDAFLEGDEWKDNIV